MSGIFKFPYQHARELALRYMESLMPYCERIEIAGSIRRKKAEVGDIELVAIPKTDIVADMFGHPLNLSSALDTQTKRLAISWGAVVIKNGPRYKKFALAEGLALDLFIVMPPANWGVIFTIRTGPGEFSNALVTPRNQRTKEGRRGLLPSWARVDEGHVKHRETGKPVGPMPEERDFFKFCELEYILPEERK